MNPYQDKIRGKFIVGLTIPRALFLLFVYIATLFLLGKLLWASAIFLAGWWSLRADNNPLGLWLDQQYRKASDYGDDEGK